MGNNPVAVGEDIESKPGQLDREELNGKPGKPSDDGEYEYFGFAEVGELLGLSRAQVRDAFIKGIQRNQQKIKESGFEYLPPQDRIGTDKPMRRKIK